MATGKISKRTVDLLKAGSRTELLWDTDLKGFGAKITPSGSLTYLIQFRMGGREAKTRRYTIGTHARRERHAARTGESASIGTAIRAAGDGA